MFTAKNIVLGLVVVLATGLASFIVDIIFLAARWSAGIQGGVFGLLKYEYFSPGGLLVAAVIFTLTLLWLSARHCTTHTLTSKQLR